jgi:hypothetical protein
VAPLPALYLRLNNAERILSAMIYNWIADQAKSRDLAAQQNVDRTFPRISSEKSGSHILQREQPRFAGRLV